MKLDKIKIDKINYKIYINNILLKDLCDKSINNKDYDFNKCIHYQKGNCRFFKITNKKNIKCLYE